MTDPKCPICGGTGWILFDVPVDDPRFGKAVPCRCKQREMIDRQLHQLRHTGNVEHLTHMTFDSFQETTPIAPEQNPFLPAAKATCLQFAKNPHGWLMLRGGHGCGKTHLAAAIANYCTDQGVPTLFEVVPDLLDQLRSTYAPSSPLTYDEHLEAIRNIHLLILDDLGTHNATPWAAEKLYQILNYRYNAQLPTIMTTNQTLNEIDPRLASRLGDRHLVQLVEFVSPDFRMDGKDKTFGSLDPYQAMTFSTLRVRPFKAFREAQQVAERYADNPHNWLIVRGDYGTGKTHIAAAIANHIQRRGIGVFFVSVPDLMDYLRATFSPGAGISYDRRFNQVKGAPLLVLDDMSTQNASAWAREKLFQLLNTRFLSGASTIVTCSNNEWDQLDERLRSRMSNQDRCTQLILDVPPYSGAEADHQVRRSTRKRE